MPKLLIILALVLALSGAVGGIFYAGVLSGESRCEARHTAADMKALEDQHAKADKIADKVAAGARQSAEDDKTISRAADEREEVIRHADLSPEPMRDMDHENTDVPAVRCTDPRGPEYYRMLRENRADPTADTPEPGSAVPD